MAIFNFYAYKIGQAEGEHDFFQESDESIKKYASAEECFGSFFNSKHSFQLPILKSKRRGKEKTQEFEKYNCEVARHENGIILMTIENNKFKHTIIDKKDHKNPHHPFCNIIIDNRQGKQIIGIERNSAFDNNTDKVAQLLAHGMGMLMKPYHKKMTINRLKKRNTEFWSVVDDVITKFKDAVKQIRLDFNGEEEKNSGDLVQLLSSLARKTESIAVFMLNAEGDGEVKLQEIHEDLTNMAKVCLAQKNYDLSVKFKKFGIYRYGSDLLAQFGIEEEYITQFEEGTKVLDFYKEATDFEGNIQNVYELEEWLNKLGELLNEYKNDTIPTGRKSRHRV